MDWMVSGGRTMKFTGVTAALICALPAWGQIRLSEVVSRAASYDAGIEAAKEKTAQAALGILTARTAYRPTGNAVGQVNRATRNNVFGMLLPNGGYAPISGPPLAANAGTNVWGSLVGFLVSWEPVDFGQRAARLKTAEAEMEAAAKAEQERQFAARASAADAYLCVLAADAAKKSAEASLERARKVEEMTRALAKAGLKPESDWARARAEKAAAETQVVEAERAARLARVAVTEWVGGDWSAMNPSAEWAAKPAPALEPGADAKMASLPHPLIAARQALVQTALAREKAASLAWRPRFELQSALYARGTGANADGTTGGGASGLGPNVYNWALGFTATFPLFEGPRLKAEREIEQRRIREGRAGVRKAEQELTAQAERARAALDAAVKLRGIAPEQTGAARANFEQSRARYQAGLATLVELADAQRTLAQAEIDEALAGLAVWRAQLALAVARGDLNPFLEMAGER
ncbi:MAG: TolC family protein [Bryobacteraceae bacterium]|nr:TolC family protein [Bryobacteraceae bacterium]